MERKIQAEFLYEGFGFPVVLKHVPMVRVRGAWTPDINFNVLSDRLMEALAMKKTRLTGSEIRFFRNARSMTLQQFAHRFGVTHPAVLKWERAGNQPTAMNWATEKDIRLEMLSACARQDPIRFHESYCALEVTPSDRSVRLRLEVGAMLLARGQREATETLR